MNEKNFWKAIGMLDWEKAGDDEAVISPLITHLASLKNEDIFAFENHLAKKLFALDTKAHASEIGEDAFISDNEHFSVDWFLYARCVVVANGKALFYAVLADASEFPKDMEFEALLTIAQEAFDQKNSSAWEYSPEVSYETFSNSEGWKDKT